MQSNDLREYLIYMQQLGFAGLYLKENPFSKPANVTPVDDVPGGSPRTKVKPIQRPDRQTPKVVQQSLGNVLKFVANGSNGQINREKARAIEGDTKQDAFSNLHAAFANCEACALGTTRRNLVFGQGALDTPLMFVGEGPGREEDKQGLAFVGAAGQLLTRIIKAMGYERDQVFIGNVVKCRPPMNRNPLPDEMATCGPILERQVEIIQPKVIVALGATAFHYFKGRSVSIMRNRGTFFDWRSFTIMPTYHPAYLLRNPSAKRDVWQDMQKVMATLKETKS